MELESKVEDQGSFKFLAIHSKENTIIYLLTNK
jgi:hypothetical protein